MSLFRSSSDAYTVSCSATCAKYNQFPDSYYRTIFHSVECLSFDCKRAVEQALKHPKGFLYVATANEKAEEEFLPAGALVGIFGMPRPTLEAKDTFKPYRLPIAYKIPDAVEELPSLQLRGFIPAENTLTMSDDLRSALLAQLRSDCDQKKFAFAHAFIQHNDVEPIVTEEDGFTKIPVYPGQEESDYFSVYPPKNWAEHWKR